MRHLIVVFLITFCCKNIAIGQCVPFLIQNYTGGISQSINTCGINIINVMNESEVHINIVTNGKFEVSNTTILGSRKMYKTAAACVIDILENTDIVSHPINNNNNKIDFSVTRCYNNSNNTNNNAIVTHKICRLVYTLYKPTISNCIIKTLSLGGYLNAMNGGHFELLVWPYDENGVRLDSIVGYDANNKSVPMRGKWFIKLNGETEFSSKDVSEYIIYPCGGQGITIVMIILHHT